ncbi:hypothetical protein B0T25DRAFT_119642 [Lasiosphaeria hispida]|uniref:Uncharacterized protein n=1 Tax=Lasiosphaeria hispida TaxID=260671 RepID=A0AAJ0HRZ6_9PEZI|nr:hypothetical protein B0T25DRAFT_119642 [Lasiosphaeria hispida]
MVSGKALLGAFLWMWPRGGYSRVGEQCRHWGVHCSGSCSPSLVASSTQRSQRSLKTAQGPGRFAGWDGVRWWWAAVVKAGSKRPNTEPKTARSSPIGAVRLIDLQHWPGVSRHLGTLAPFLLILGTLLVCPSLVSAHSSPAKTDTNLSETRGRQVGFPCKTDRSCSSVCMSVCPCDLPAAICGRNLRRWPLPAFACWTA